MSALRHMVALVGLAAALVGCSFDTNGFPISSVENTCSQDTDCGAGYCTGDRFCATERIAPIEVAVEVVPKATDQNAPAHWQFAPQMIAESTTSDLTTPLPTIIVGRVRYGQVFVPARITVRAPRLMPELDPVVLTTQTSIGETGQPIAQDGQPYDFRLAFGSGVRVRIRVEPLEVPSTAPADLRALDANAVLPPLEAELTLESGEMRVDFTYPTDIFSPCTQERTTLCTVTLAFANQTPEHNHEALSVIAVTDDESVVSSYGRIEDGTVSLRLGRPLATSGQPAPRISVLVGPSTVRTDFLSSRPSFPTFRITDLPTGGLLTVVLPSPSALTLAGSVESLNERPLAGATLRFISRTLEIAYDGEVTHERLVMTTPEAPGTTPGRFDVELYPGTYDVIVTPASASDGGVLYTTATVVAPANGATMLLGQIFRVPPATTLGGRVITFASVAAPYVDVEADPFPTSGARPALTQTDPLGNFSVPLDVGNYDIVVSPWVGSGFATQIVTYDPEAYGPIEIALSPPIVLSGVVRAADGVPLALARVNVYRIMRGIVDRTILVASVETEADGAYRVLLTN